tara:strand:- start:3839 stop:4591 length:753 start_codon:yes stop_codon:yes gene_type:complete
MIQAPTQPLASAANQAAILPEAAAGGGDVLWSDYATLQWDVSVDAADPMIDLIEGADANPSSTTYRAAPTSHPTLNNRWFSSSGRFETVTELQETRFDTDAALIMSYVSLQEYTATRQIQRRSTTTQIACTLASDETTITVWNGNRFAVFPLGFNPAVTTWRTLAYISTPDSIRYWHEGVEITPSSEDYTGSAASTGFSSPLGGSAGSSRVSLGEIIFFDKTVVDDGNAPGAILSAHDYLQAKWIDTDGT